MTLSSLDWSVIGLYLALSLALGLWFARRGQGSFLDFILSGRGLPWWLAGTSVVATTFSVDTPLYVTELVRAEGISGNWQWWSAGIGGAMGVLAITFFASRWRRAEIATEVEFVELRYGGRPAAFLRGFKAIYFALVKNTLGLAVLLLAMSRVLEVNLGLPPESGTWAATGIAVAYTLFAGLWGVILTDFFQFVVAMVGSIVLAVFALQEVGGVGGLEERLAQVGRSSALAMVPHGGPSTLAPVLFFVYLGVLWWTHINADGGGMFVQRMAACKDERHASAGALWAIFAHYVLRSWPWILAAMVSIVVLPEAPDRAAYPMLVGLYLPSGWRGLMVVAFLAAFMSTVSTLLNWGASVLVNDLYKRFLAPSRADRHYVRAAQAATVVLVLLAIPFARGETRVREIVEAILGLGSGFGPVLIARWLWWRTNAWSEVSGILASSAATALFFFVPEARALVGSLLGGSGADYELAGRFLGTTILSAAVWVPSTLLTSPVPRDLLQRFQERLRPIGFWPTSGRAGSLVPELRQWILGVVFLFSSLFSIGDLCLGRWRGALLFGTLGAASGVVFLWDLLRGNSRGT